MKHLDSELADLAGYTKMSPKDKGQSHSNWSLEQM